MIPKILHQIWVGPLPPPTKWLNTWVEKHPKWQYKLWGNEELKNKSWTNRRHIDSYIRRGLWSGVADIMRYQILYEFGGILTAADSECLHPLDGLFRNNFQLFAVNTGFYEGGPIVKKNLGSVAPLYASVPGHWFPLMLTQEIFNNNYLSTPVRSTGNRLMQRSIKKYRPEIKIWPMHYFIPEHFNGWKYEGKDIVYARHFWGTTRKTYSQGILKTET